MSAIRQFLQRLRSTGVRRPQAVKTVAMGRERVFDAFDAGDDTYIVERGVASRLSERPSVLLAEKRDLGRKSRGRVMTLSTGNHSVAAFPLLDGRFWRISRLHPSRRSETLLRSVICANVVDDAIEISQREVPTRKVVLCDGWLRAAAGFAMDDVVMVERNDATLDHYRQLGQEWRVKPLAWTEAEMKTALSASRKRISAKLNYYHSAKGVHFLSFPEFRRFSELAQSEPDEFVKGLRELVSVYEGNEHSFVRMPKCRGHHEIEFFGLGRAVALEKLIPEIERLFGEIESGRIGQLGVIQKAQELVAVFGSLLSKGEYAHEESKEFVESLYMHITGEIYSVVGEGSTPAFDDRRTALPGATFVDGKAQLHPGIDERTEILLSNIRSHMSKDEIIEYANVYELRTEDGNRALGRGKTREIVYKTNRGPLEHSLVEKRLSRASKGYSSYMLARVEAFKALGVHLSEYRILRRQTRQGRGVLDYYIRRRCEGEPLEAIPANYYCSADDSSVEEKEVVLAMAALMGDAAAQNMAMKKYDPETMSPLYGIGKEIYEFEYDIAAQRVVPKSVSTCSVRGSFGWPDLSYDDANLQAIADFYLRHFARSLKGFVAGHEVSVQEAAQRFMDGFEFRTRAMEWQLSVMRDRFEAFRPRLPSKYDFDRKWRFVMWSLERQERRLPVLRKMFFRHLGSPEGGEW
jgi:hypothetical protein